MLGYLRIILTAHVRSERGASAVEYGLLVAFIAAACIGVLEVLGNTLQVVFDQTNDSITTGP